MSTTTNALPADAAPMRTEPIQRSEVLGSLRALVDDTRLQILELLASHETLSAQEIIAQLDVGQSTVSRHLQQLIAAGFVIEQRSNNTNKSYCLRVERLHELFATLHQLLTPENSAAIRTDIRRELPEVLHRFVDREGLVTIWPRRERDREAILEYLV